MQDTEQRRKKIETLVKWIALPVIGFFVAPFIFITIKGLIGLIVSGVISLTAINFTPWLAMKLANWRLKALKFEAGENPIETLENQYQERETALLAFRDNIKSFSAEVQNFYSELEGFKQEYPASAGKFDTQYSNMRALLVARADKYKKAKQNLESFSRVIDQKRSEWKIAQAAAKMSKAAGVGEDFMAKLMTDTALDSVQTSLNTAFAELEVSLLDEKDGRTTVVVSPSMITEHAGPPTLDLEIEPIKERVPVVNK